MLESYFDKEEVDDIHEIKSQRKEDLLKTFKEFKKSRNTKELIRGLRMSLERYRKEEKKEKVPISLSQNPIMKRRDSNAKKERISLKSSPVQKSMNQPT